MNEGALHVSADSKRQSNSAEGISNRLSECLHLVYYCRSHFSESDLPPTDDEDETLDTKSGPFSLKMVEVVFDPFPVQQIIPPQEIIRRRKRRETCCLKKNK